MKADKELTEIKVSDIRMIKLYMDNKHASSYFIPENDIEKFLKATLALHYKPGINPHNKRETNKVIRITQIKPRADRFWWSTPDLQENDDPRGALVISFCSHEEELWKAP